MLVRHPFHRLVSAYNDKMLGKSEYYAPLSKEINRRYRSLRYKVSERTAPDSGRATFEDFVNFLVHSSNKDMHWERFEVICGPCFHHYDVFTAAKCEFLNSLSKTVRPRLLNFYLILKLAYFSESTAPVQRLTAQGDALVEKPDSFAPSNANVRRRVVKTQK